jgi:hypothetical protein
MKGDKCGAQGVLYEYPAWTFGTKRVGKDGERPCASMEPPSHGAPLKCPSMAPSSLYPCFSPIHARNAHSMQTLRGLGLALIARMP